MRLHELEIVAFGPFTDRVHVDLDDLASGGLFLLTGPTGAGKTSVLDAICFALYGEVPGERNGAKRLRSDRADAAAEPRVRLVATLAGRRFELTRSPGWQRPKKRGTGTTTQQATVLVRELVDDRWTTHTTRLDEAGHLVTSLLGMNLAQFTQVAMLPQGRFQAFLRAGSDERQRLLQRLFGTARFERAEIWLRERRSGLRRRHESAHRILADAVSRVSEAADQPLHDWDLDDLTEPGREGDLERWSTDLAAAARGEHGLLAGAGDVVERAERAASAASEQARVLLEQHRRRAEARAELADLEDRTARHDAEVRQADRGRRARSVEPVQQVALAAARRLDLAEREEDQARREAWPLLDETRDAVTTDADTTDADRTDADVDWSALVRAEEQAAADARALRPSAARAAVAQRERDDQRVRASELHDRRDHLVTRQHEIPLEIARLRERSVAADQAVAEVGHRHEALAALRRRRQALTSAVEFRRILTGARERHHAAREETLARREGLLVVRERRLAGMAAEIAGDLAVGGACPVCGSADHPRRAVPAPDSSDAASERDAQSALDDANADEYLRHEEVRDLETRIATAETLAGDQVETLDDDLAEAATRLASVQQLAEGARSLRAALISAEQAERQDADALALLSTDVTRAESAVIGLDTELRELDALLSQALGDHDDVDALERGHIRRATTARRAADARETVRVARDQALAAEQTAARTADEAGFEDTDDAHTAHLGPAALADLEASVRRHRERVSAVRALLRETEDPAADGMLPGVEPGLPDLDVLLETHRAALEDLKHHHARLSAARRRAERLDILDRELRAAVAGWRPVADELDLVTRLSAFVDGRSVDNRWQIRLSAYVLAFRLSQVVSAANLRLARMSDRRYALEHTAERGRDRHGGLGLLVRDDWSGLTRDPATLSGGETFVVSLALALGLADVISAEAGGVELGTLFVDEGFGSLDADTLDDVMDTLDGLRDGGRLVGVVSHVAEMRDRIPTQLGVTKERRGSALTVHR